MEKVAREERFIDLSDYARPIARKITMFLAPSSISSVSVTLFHSFLGFIASFLLLFSFYYIHIIAALLLFFKNTLDAVDGSLARVRKRPSRIGRYLDSIADAMVSFLLFSFAGIREFGISPLFLLAPLAFLSQIFQCSYYNYQVVKYRHKKGGDKTSLLQEQNSKPYLYDNPHIFSILKKIYLLIYGWQDKIMSKLDFNPNSDRIFLTLVSPLGLGFSLLVFIILIILRKIFLLFPFFIVFMNLYWVFLLVLSRVSYRERRKL